MKKLLLVLAAMVPLFLMSCVSTEVVDPMEVGLKPSEVKGTIIKVETEGTLFSDTEFNTIAKEANKQGYKYFVILNKDGGTYESGYYMNSHKVNDKFTFYTMDKTYSYATELTAYLFNDEEEVDTRLSKGQPVYRTAKYL